MPRNVTKLDEALIARICELLVAGHYRVTVAQLVGIHEVTFSKWMNAKREPYLSFQLLVKEAEAEAERLQLAKIIDSPDPADAKWYLARKFPDRWAETKRVDVSGRLDLAQRINVPADSQNADVLSAITTLSAYVFGHGDGESGADGESDNEGEL